MLLALAVLVEHDRNYCGNDVKSSMIVQLRITFSTVFEPDNVTAYSSFFQADSERLNILLYI